MPHARLQALIGQRHRTLSAMEVVLSSVPLTVGPGAGHQRRRRRGRLARRASPHGQPRQPHLWLHVIVALGITAVILGTLPLGWRVAHQLSERSAQAITRATIDGFGGAIGGGVLGPVLSGQR